jgi:hypothetical protein
MNEVTMKIKRWIGILLSSALLIGCSSSFSWQPTVSLKVATSGSLSSGQSLAGTAMTILLPSGATPPLDASGQVDTSRLVNASGQSAAGGLAATAVYIEATGAQPAQLSIVVASQDPAGFGIGEFMTLTLNRAFLKNFNAADFVISEFAAADLDGNPVNGLQAKINGVSY